MCLHSLPAHPPPLERPDRPDDAGAGPTSYPGGMVYPLGYSELI